MMSAIIGAIIGIAKAVPIIANLIDELVTTWTNTKIAEMNVENIKESEARTIILGKIANAKDNKERAALAYAYKHLRQL